MFIRLLSCTTFKFQQRSFGKTNRTPPDEIYRGIETDSCSFFSGGGGRNTFGYG